MSIKTWIEQARAEGRVTDVVVYANIGNNTDELVVCEPAEADDAGCVIVDVYYVEHNAFARTAVITAEVV